MSTIVTRYGKGSPLTWLEVDNNFTNLNADKIQSGDTVASLTINSATISGGSINGTTIGGSTPSSGAFTSLTDSGNLTFTGTGNRITGDFSNTTIANQVLFQTSTTNNNTQLRAIPNGTGTQSGFFFYDTSDTTNNAFGAIRTVATTDVRLQSGITGTGTYLPMTFYTGGSEAMRIDTSRNVGIGTSNPGVRLRVEGANDTTFSPNVFNTRIVGTNSATSGNAGAGIAFLGYTTGTSTFSDLAFISGIKANTTDGNYDGALVFGVRTNASGGGSFERMRITSSGNVGIGITTVETHLQVYGAGTTSTSWTNGDASGAALYLRDSGGAANNGGQLLFGASQGSFAGIKGLLANGTGPAGELIFQTRTTTGNIVERMRISELGNVGIGTTAIRSATLVNALNGYTASNNGATNPYFQLYNGNAGTNLKHWRIGGISDGAIAFETVNDAYSAATERMRIDSSGNVLVTSSALLGYGGGSGGTVTQATSKSTAVTLNKPTGKITTNNAALAAGATVGFQCNNTFVTVNDTIILTFDAGLASVDANYSIRCSAGSGAIFFTLKNESGGSRSEAIGINFSVIKGSTT